MAITQTTLSSAVAVTDVAINVASATGFAAGSQIRIDQESMKVAANYPGALTLIPVIRGVGGTANAAHKSAAFVIVELASDLPAVPPQAFTQFPTIRAKTVTSISVTGAIPLPLPGSDGVVLLNGTTIIAATLANPTKDMDGDRLTIIGNGKAAHTVTYTAGFGNIGATADVITFHATMAQSVEMMACGGFWVGVGSVAGAASVAGSGIG